MQGLRSGPSREAGRFHRGCGAACDQFATRSAPLALSRELREDAPAGYFVERAARDPAWREEQIVAALERGRGEQASSERRAKGNIWQSRVVREL